MKKHLTIALILLLSVSLSACNKAETLTETSSVLSTQETKSLKKPYDVEATEYWDNPIFLHQKPHQLLQISKSD